MATIDRIEPAYQPWSPTSSEFTTTATGEQVEEYIGRHRKPGLRVLGLLRMFYSGRHRA